MTTHETRPALTTAALRRARQAAMLAAATLFVPAFDAAAATTWTVTGWNNLGMHCMDSDFSVFCILPPYNTVEAQTVRGVDGTAQLMSGGGLTLTYHAVADPDGSINSTSIGKGNFWDYVQPLFGVGVPPDSGLPVPGPNAYAMPGVANRPQFMIHEPAFDWYVAYGIPITPFDDLQHKNAYPLMRLVAWNNGAPVSATDVVLPVSDEMDCRLCHGSGGQPAAQPAAGWVYDADPTRDYRRNILRLHDEMQTGNATFANALAAQGYHTGGLHATVTANGRPILCAACHASEALPGSGMAGLPPLTRAVHALHATVADPGSGVPLDSESSRTACYLCHPGSATRCLRGAMGAAVAANGTMSMQCQSCHGSMSAVGAASRTGWMDEPDCQACHTGDALSNSGQIRFTSVFASPGVVRVPANRRFATTPNSPLPGKSLFRFSRGHGGLYCSACHGSTHSEFSSTHRNDNITSLQHQGHSGVLVECATCHGGQPSTVTGGPHGLHPVGATWVSRHDNVAESGGAAACRTCHGTLYNGGVLSQSQRDQVLAGRSFWRGQRIGCYDCHNGPGGEGGAPAAPTANSASAATPTGQAVTIALNASTANLRIVSQPGYGTVGLVNNRATYYPPTGFVGTDHFTFAASSATRDSNLASVTVTATRTGPCVFTLSPDAVTVSSVGGVGSVTVGVACTNAWTGASDARWLTILSRHPSQGAGTVVYRIDPNTGNVRAGTLTIAGQTFIVTQYPGIWSGAVDGEGGWKHSPWFGTFLPLSGGWIYHVQHGYLYPIGIDPNSIWFWDHSRQTWWWSAEGTYPYLYRLDGAASTWLWYVVGTAHPRYLYNVTTASAEAWP